MTRMWRKSTGVESLLAVRPLRLTLAEDSCCVIGCKVYILPSFQVSLGRSEKQKYTMRGERESRPSLKVSLIHRASARATLGTL